MPDAIRLRLCAVLTSCVLLLGCDASGEAWASARDDGSLTALEDFLAAFPESAQADSARLAIESIRWAIASGDDDETAYQTFLELHPNGTHADTARARIEEFAWEEAQLADHRTTYQRFLERHPDGRHAEEARRKLEFMEGPMTVELIPIGGLFDLRATLYLWGADVVYDVQFASDTELEGDFSGGWDGDAMQFPAPSELGDVVIDFGADYRAQGRVIDTDRSANGLPVKELELWYLERLEPAP